MSYSHFCVKMTILKIQRAQKIAFFGVTIGYIDFIFGKNHPIIITQESLWGFFKILNSTQYSQGVYQFFKFWKPNLILPYSWRVETKHFTNSPGGSLAIMFRWFSSNNKLIWLIVTPIKCIDWALLDRILKSYWWYFQMHHANKG